MLTLITGQPGNGKTLYALTYVKAWAEREKRPVWYHGIADLTLNWQALPVQVEKINGRDIEVPQWWTAPANSIIVIDEVQNAGFGVRPRGQVPEWAQRLETHRHLGLDIVMITQSPSLLDSHDRALCELHFHVMRNFGMARATIHEFRPVRDNVLKSRKGSIEHHWSYPKEAFSYYKSAEAHTHKARIPMRVWLLFALPVFIAIMGWIAWHYYLSPNRDSLTATSTPTQATASTTTTQHTTTRTGEPLTTAEYLAQYEPRVAGLAYTAPIYDQVTQPTHAPMPTACVSNARKCECYSEQATRLDMPDDLCRSIVSGGFYVAWQNGQGEKQTERPAVATPVTTAPEPAPMQAFGFDAGDVRTSPIHDVRSNNTGDLDDGPRPMPGRGHALPPPSMSGFASR